MTVSKKCQYAVRAILELAKRGNRCPVSISDIAAKQAAPARFLEAILAELRHGKYVDSRRGAQGGWLLLRSPKDITVGEIIRFVDGPLDPVDCLGEETSQVCALRGQCALVGLWRRAKEAVESVYDSTTFQDLVDQERALNRSAAPDLHLAL
jgi:Rrf2 family protein